MNRHDDRQREQKADDPEDDAGDEVGVIATPARIASRVFPAVKTTTGPRNVASRRRESLEVHGHAKFKWEP
jgi:hypothetical protein